MRKDDVNYKFAFKLVMWLFIFMAVSTTCLILLVSKYMDYKENEVKFVDNDCFKGCEYGFTRGEKNIIAVNGFTREDCKKFCAISLSED